MKEGDVVDEIEPAVSSTLGEEERTAKRKLVEGTSALRWTYNVDLSKLAEQHELGIGKDVRAKVDLALEDSLYNVWNDRKYDHAKYDEIGSSDMKDMAKAREDVMKPGRHWHLSCSAFEPGSWYRSLDSEKVRASQ